MKILLTFIILILFMSISCGVYTFNPRGKSDITTISIEPFNNQTSEFGLTDRLTELVIDEFIADGNLKVVGSAQADAILQGTLLNYQRVPYRFDENDQVQEYKVVMGLEISLIDPDENTEKWKQRMDQEGIYDAVTETEEVGQQRAAERLVEAILNKTTKSW